MAKETNNQETKNEQEENQQALESFQWDKEPTSLLDGFADDDDEVEDEGKDKANNFNTLKDTIAEDGEELVDDDEKNEGGEEDEEGNEEKGDDKEPEDKGDKTIKKDKPKKDASTNPSENTSDYSGLLADLKDEGYFRFAELPELEEGKTLTREEFFELQEKELELREDASLKEIFSSLDETGAEYIKFIKNGGKTEDFITTFVEESIPADLDMEDKNNQLAVLKHFYATVENLDEEEIEDKIKWLEDNNKLKADADKKYSKLQAEDKKRKEDLLKQAEDKKKQDLEDRKKFASKLVSTLNKKEIGDMPLTPQDRKELADFITKPSERKGGRVYTGLQSALNKVLKNEEALIVLGKLLKNYDDKKGFDFSMIKAKGKSDKVRDIKNGINRLNKDKDPKSSGGTRQKSLADFFPG